jgi:hypothetical protein
MSKVRISDVDSLSKLCHQLHRLEEVLSGTISDGEASIHSTTPGDPKYRSSGTASVVNQATYDVEYIPLDEDAKEDILEVFMRMKHRIRRQLLDLGITVE